MARAQHASGSARKRRFLVAAGAVVVVAGAMVGISQALDSHPSAPPAPAPAAPAPTLSSAPTAAAPAGVAACAGRVRAAEGALTAAEPGIQDWRQHTQAFRDLIAARTPYADADRTWARTRGQGPTDMAGWTTSWTTYTGTAGACEAVVEQAAPGQAAVARACAARAAAADRAAGSARTVMQAWSDHLQQMRERNEGTLDRAQTNALFNRAVRATPGQLAALQRDRDELGRAPACPA